MEIKPTAEQLNAEHAFKYTQVQVFVESLIKCVFLFAILLWINT